MPNPEGTLTSSWGGTTRVDAGAPSCVDAAGVLVDAGGWGDSVAEAGGVLVGMDVGAPVATGMDVGATGASTVLCRNC